MEMKTIKLNSIEFKYMYEDNLGQGDCTFIFYENAELNLYYSTYCYGANNNNHIIEAIKSDFDTRK